MKVRALITGADLTYGKVYDVIFEHDTVYELECDTGIYCRNKNFFEVVVEDCKKGVCPHCGGSMQTIIGGDGVQCDTCYFIIRSDGKEDYNEMEESE